MLCSCTLYKPDTSTDSAILPVSYYQSMVERIERLRLKRYTRVQFPVGSRIMKIGIYNFPVWRLALRYSVKDPPCVVDRWQLDLKTDRSLRCLLAKLDEEDEISIKLEKQLYRRASNTIKLRASKVKTNNHTWKLQWNYRRLFAYKIQINAK